MLSGKQTLKIGVCGPFSRKKLWRFLQRTHLDKNFQTLEQGYRVTNNTEFKPFKQAIAPSATNKILIKLVMDDPTKQAKNQEQESIISFSTKHDFILLTLSPCIGERSDGGIGMALCSRA
ncbi:hypothetical protein VP01_405g1 [Puccinia sorghi]|uniref:Uncharacterized protein n=1 Tax=Puccinia sorghi TaxID=27349 RepID=A0A0L6URK1_9BASI|nr:hypothetical protein VP01_405g1 [Puccinia sorghi]